VWQDLRNELHAKGLEVVTVSLDMTGAEGSRGYIEAASAEHPSLLDPGHVMDALFGVVNIPNVVWINEEGVIVRPPEPGWPSGETKFPTALFAEMPKVGRAPTAPTRPDAVDQMTMIRSGQDRASYADAIRDWVEKGAASEFALTPEQVIERSQQRPITVSEGAAHFELALHLWEAGDRDGAIAHFNECHRLQPNNWTYKRQAYSLIGHERVGGDIGRFVQGPLVGEEESWPFTSDFRSEVAMLDAGQYYPVTM
jgi:hypothetical protein